MQFTWEAEWDLKEVIVKEPERRSGFLCSQAGIPSADTVV